MNTKYSVENLKPVLLLLKEKLHLYNYNKYARRMLVVNFINIRYYPFFEYTLREETPVNILILLFILGAALSYRSVRLVFSTKEINTLCAAGILSSRPSKDKISSNVKITPYEEFNFISDFVTRMPDRMFHKYYNEKHDLVYSPGNDSQYLSSTRIPKEFEATLDLCTGSGIHAILASKISKRVIGVDINPRAVHYATANLVLNNISNVEFRLGDLYEPVRAEKFDYIITNTPFIITKNKDQLYFDGGRRGGKIFNRVLFGLSRQLKMGGYCHITMFFGEFAGISQIRLFEQWVYKHKYRALVLATPALNNHSLALVQYGEWVADFKKYNKKIKEYLEYLDKVKLKKTIPCVIIIRKGLRCRFKRYNITGFEGSIVMLKNYFADAL